jgi:hypothetical protein
MLSRRFSVIYRAFANIVQSAPCSAHGRRRDQPGYVMFNSIDERTASAGTLAAAVLVGLFCHPLAALAAPLAIPALFLVVVFALIPFVDLPRADILNVRIPTLRLVLWQQLVLPALVVSLCIVAKLPDHAMVVAVVMVSSGSIFASPALAEMLGLDRRRALQGMVLSTLVTPITLYVFLSFFREASNHINMVSFAQRVVLFLFVPFLTFAAFRLAARRLPKSVTTKAAEAAKYATIAALMVFCVGIMHAISGELTRNPLHVFFNIAVASLMCAGMLAVTAIVFYRFGPTEGLTAGLLSGLRNAGLGYALVGDSLGLELAIFVGAAMIPMFITPFAVRLHHVASGRQSDTTLPQLAT